MMTYYLNPKATWADGTAITSADFDFTWRARMHTPIYAVLSPGGYEQIQSIDVGDPKTVVIRFKSVVTGWQELFGGPNSGLLEKAAFPRSAATRLRT